MCSLSMLDRGMKGEHIMGICGCGEYDAVYRFKGPGEITYVVQIYPGCNECCTPAGIILYAFTEEDMELWDAIELPEFQIHNEGTGIPVIDPAILKGRMSKVCGEDTEEAIMCEELIDNLFEGAVSATIEDDRRKIAKL